VNYTKLFNCKSQTQQKHTEEESLQIYLYYENLHLVFVHPQVGCVTKSWWWQRDSPSRDKDTQ